MTFEAFPLVDGEFELDAQGEDLWRQASPSHLEQDGTLSYLIFRPTTVDDRKLSVFRGSSMSAQQAYENRVDLGRESLGTLSVSVGQVRNEAHLRAVDDAALPDRPSGHAYVDFRGLTKREAKTAAVNREDP